MMGQEAADAADILEDRAKVRLLKADELVQLIHTWLVYAGHSRASAYTVSDATRWWLDSRKDAR